MSGGGGWTPERVERLRAMAREGLSATEAGRRLGVSRSAALGKAHRCGFAFVSRQRAVADGSPARAPDMAPDGGARERDAEAGGRGNVVALPVVPRAPVPRDPVPVLDVRAGQCRFPLWPGKGHVPFDQKFYCGAPVGKAGASWCAGCSARVWSGREARDGQSLATAEPGLGRQDRGGRRKARRGAS